MLNSKIVLFSAKARNGKDCSASIMKTFFEEAGKTVMIIHFADALKMICEKCYGWIPGDKGPVGRTILQKVGAEFRRNREECWVNIVKEIARGTDAEYVLVPDCRYKNEVLGFMEFVSYAIRIERPNFDNGLTESQKAHISETDLDNYEYFDYTVINDGTIEDLKEKIKEITKNII